MDFSGDWFVAFPEMRDKTISSCVVGQDNGYDYITIICTDDTTLTFMEDGQAGWCKMKFNQQGYVRVGGIHDMEKEMNNDER